MRAWILVAVIVVLAGVPRISRADDDNKKLARDEFNAGQDADRRKDYDVAIQHYLRAYDLSPHPNALYNAAVDYERIGELRESATFYGRYLDESPDSEDRGKVTRLIENLRKRPSLVQVRTTPPGGQITIDGAPAGQAPVSGELAGGTTHVVVAVIGDRRSERQVPVEYGEPAEVVIALTEQQGTLTVTSNVAGAQVEIDGASAGTTPLTVAVAAGERKVIVHGEGYSTLERVVKVPAEGSAQITATLVRPLGYVDPTAGTVLRSWVFSAEGGRVFQAETNVFHIGFGYRVKGWEAAGRLAYFGTNTSLGYGLLIRKYLGSSKIRPYLGAIGEYGAAKSSSSSSATIYVLGAHAGVMLELATTDRFAVEVTVDGGAALFASEGERKLAFPITASLQFRGR